MSKPWPMHSMPDRATGMLHNKECGVQVGMHFVPRELCDIQNPWGAHFHNKHSGTPTPDLPFIAKIVKRTTDHVERKLSEAIDSRNFATDQH